MLFLWRLFVAMQLTVVDDFLLAVAVRQMIHDQTP